MISIKAKSGTGVSESVINNSAILVNWVYPFYDSIEYREYDKLQYASKTFKMHYADFANTPQTNLLSIIQTEIIVFNSLWFDLASIKYIDFGHHYFSYAL